MIKCLIKSTTGGEDSSPVIHFDLSNRSCVNTPLGKLFEESSGLSRGRVEYNKVLLEVYDCFIHVEMLDHFGLDTHDAGTEAHDAAHGLFSEDTWLNCDSIKDCKRGLELYAMCDTYNRKNVREAGFDRNGYFNAHDELDEAEKRVHETLNKRIDELHRQRINNKKANKQAPKLEEKLSKFVGSYGGLF